ncbi:AMP-binding protein [Puia sp. P3]|uniref:AMP-binding protein n=1 Tax=Puia sp. P3 TaxID=3423952 RepID=UPI003D67310B
MTENCLDRHLAERGDEPAIIWEPNNPEEDFRVLSYKELHFKVCQVANVLKNNGLKKGDRVCIYMPMVPELAIAVLACARLGVIHSVVFGGFSAQSIADRIQDAQCSLVITCDRAFRGNKEILAEERHRRRTGAVSIRKKGHRTYPYTRSREHDKGSGRLVGRRGPQGGDAGNPVCPAEIMDAEDVLFILYTSGSTGKPKGVVHTCGGYMVFTAYSFVNVFQYQPGDVYFCTADIGWITGHSYIVYGPLAAGATTLMFEGIPTWPDAGRFWDVVDKFKVNILYTAPTAIRSLMGFGLDFVKNKDSGVR